MRANAHREHDVFRRRVNSAGSPDSSCFTVRLLSGGRFIEATTGLETARGMAP